MGEVKVAISVRNPAEPERCLQCIALVDSGATGLVLPAAWRAQLGELPLIARTELELADGGRVEADVCGPVLIQIQGFRPIGDEAAFLHMEPGPHGHEALVGYTVLEKCGVVVDMVSQRLFDRRHLLAKVAGSLR